jgi:hypothetical protein
LAGFVGVAGPMSSAGADADAPKGVRGALGATCSGGTDFPNASEPGVFLVIRFLAVSFGYFFAFFAESLLADASFPTRRAGPSHRLSEYLLE